MRQGEVGEAYEASTSALQAAKGQRLSLRRAIAGLEQALAVPPAGEEPGLYQEILENAPRLANRVKRFRREHADIAAAIGRGIAEAGAAGDDPARVEEVRDHALRLFADMVRHRKRGLDLVYEAYVDIGGES